MKFIFIYKKIKENHCFFGHGLWPMICLRMIPAIDHKPILQNQIIKKRGCSTKSKDDDGVFCLVWRENGHLHGLQKWLHK
jgi:hypothetical protein